MYSYVFYLCEHLDIRNSSVKPFTSSVIETAF